jgi:UDP-N-acetylglucosamine 2-epimerase
MLSLVAHAEALLTDSGGLQKESVLLGTRCLTMRNETEWIESTETGLNTVVGLDLRAAQAALAATPSTTDVAAIYPPGASARIAAILLAE